MKKYDFSNVPADKIEAVLTFALDQKFHFDGLLPDLAQHVRLVETKADVARELAELCSCWWAPRAKGHDNPLKVGHHDTIRALVDRYGKAV